MLFVVDFGVGFGQSFEQLLKDQVLLIGPLLDELGFDELVLSVLLLVVHLHVQIHLIAHLSLVIEFLVVQIALFLPNEQVASLINQQLLVRGLVNLLDYV